MDKTLKTFSFSGRSIAIGVLAFVGIIPAAHAAAIGTLNEANCAGGGVAVNQTTVTWLPVGTSAGTGCIDTGLGTSVTYSTGTLGSGVVGNIENLTPGGVVDDFMTFTATPLDFVLDGFSAPAPTNGTNCGSLANGQSCIIANGSPFLVTDVSGDAAVSLSAYGTVTDGGVTTEWSGAFTTQLTETPGAIQACIGANIGCTSGTNTIESTQSAQFIVATIPAPEPSTFVMIGGGLIGLGLFSKKRKANRP
jgi:hypothetical protein